jgi:hypothetical protein
MHMPFVVIQKMCGVDLVNEGKNLQLVLTLLCYESSNLD